MAERYPSTADQSQISDQSKPTDDQQELHEGHTKADEDQPEPMEVDHFKFADDMCVDQHKTTEERRGQVAEAVELAQTAGINYHYYHNTIAYNMF